MEIRYAKNSETSELGQIWHDAWRYAHAEIVPAELTRIRTLESFTERLRGMIADVRVATLDGRPVGFAS